MKLLTYIVGKKEMIGVLNQEETWVYPVSAAGGRSYKVIFGKNAESLSLKGDSER